MRQSQTAAVTLARDGGPLTISTRGGVLLNDGIAVRSIGNPVILDKAVAKKSNVQVRGPQELANHECPWILVSRERRIVRPFNIMVPHYWVEPEAQVSSEFMFLPLLLQTTVPPLACGPVIVSVPLSLAATVPASRPGVGPWTRPALVPVVPFHPASTSWVWAPDESPWAPASSGPTRRRGVATGQG